MNIYALVDIPGSGEKGVTNKDDLDLHTLKNLGAIKSIAWVYCIIEDPDLRRTIEYLKLQKIKFLKPDQGIAKHFVQLGLAGSDLIINLDTSATFFDNEYLQDLLKHKREGFPLINCAPLSGNFRNNRGILVGKAKDVYMETGLLSLCTVREYIQWKKFPSMEVDIYPPPEKSGTPVNPDSHSAKAKENKDFNTPIKLFLTDVDGVLTDAGMYYTEAGDELKKFNTHDGKGIELLRKAGIKIGIITSENTQIVSNRAKKLKVDYLYQGMEGKSKLESALEICRKEKLTLQQTAYIGDDINCSELLNAVGLAACPANALPAIKSITGIHVLSKSGGDGVVREFAQLILEYSV